MQATKCPGPSSRCGRHRLLAFLGRQRAARMEHAAGGRIERARQLALDDGARPGALDDGIGDRRRRQQRLGVGVLRVGEQLVGGRVLDDAPEVHDGDLGRDVAHHGQIVGDEQVGQTELLLQVLQQVDHLALDRHVERGHRLVADDHARLDRQRAGDADALALAARQLVRIAQRHVGIEADQLQQLGDARLDLGLGQDLVHVHRLGDDLADGHARIERGVGILEDHLHLLAHRRHLVALEAARCRCPRSGSRRRSGRRAAAPAGRAWTCRNRTRPPAPASRRA